MDKNAQRAQIRLRMKNLPLEYCQMADEAICHKVLGLKEYREAPIIFCYISVNREIDISSIIEDAWASGKRVAVPKCMEKGIMEAMEIHSWQDLVPGRYQIPEPKVSCRPVRPDEIAFGIIPCISCDLMGNRLGHGGGYYDRYLSDTAFVTAAVCREQLLLKHVCCEEHDRPMDLVVTESQIYHIGKF